MLGLEKEIRARRKHRKSASGEKFSCQYISGLLGKSYTAISKKLERNSFDVEEAIAIFKSIIPQERQTLDFFVYLFTQQN